MSERPNCQFDPAHCNCSPAHCCADSGLSENLGLVSHVQAHLAGVESTQILCRKAVGWPSSHIQITSHASSHPLPEPIPNPIPNTNMFAVKHTRLKAEGEGHAAFEPWIGIKETIHLSLLGRVEIRRMS